MHTKEKLRKMMEKLNSQGTYELEQNKELREAYTHLIGWFKTQTNSTSQSNIVQIKSLTRRNSKFLADTKFINPKNNQKGTKKTYLDLGDRKLLALLKDYEFMLRGSLQYVQDLYSELYKAGVTKRDFSKACDGEICKELYKFMKGKRELDEEEMVEEELTEYKKEDEPTEDVPSEGEASNPKQEPEEEEVYKRRSRHRLTIQNKKRDNTGSVLQEGIIRVDCPQPTNGPVTPQATAIPRQKKENRLCQTFNLLSV